MISRRSFLKIGSASVASFGFVGKVLSKPAPAVEAQLQNMVQDVKPLTPEDYAARTEKARRLMVENKLDGFFAGGGTTMKYFTNITWGQGERTFGVVMTPKKPPVWVCSRFELERARESIPADQEVRTWEEDESPFKLIGGIMKDAGFATGRLGIEPSTRTFVLYALKRDVPGLDIVDGAVISEGCRGIKTEKEIAYMELANKITKMAYREGFKTLREGMTSGELRAAISDAHAKMGVSGGGGGGSFGPNTAFPHGTRTVRNLQKGDNVLVDGGCKIEGFSSDITRTVFFGKPTDRQRKVWNAVKKAQTAALKACRPGVACEEVDKAARKAIDAAGFGPEYKYFTHRLGHGIGMDGHEYPYLVRENKLKLEPGMTFSNEPGIYIYGEFGVRIEDCMVVTKDGARYLGGLEAISVEQQFGKE
jgi:Xaa-Pro dipeptidase